MARIDDAWQTLITLTGSGDAASHNNLFSSDSNLIRLFEKRIKPPGMRRGGPTDTTTMRNALYRTFGPKKLRTLTPMTAVVAYDPRAFGTLLALPNSGLMVTVRVTWPNTWWLEFPGWVDEFDWMEMREGEQPEANITICPSMVNPTLYNLAQSNPATIITEQAPAVLSVG